MTIRSQTLTPTSLLADFRLLVILFISFRVLLMIVYEPILPDDGIQRGIGVGGDLIYYYDLSALTDEGYTPFVDYWSEFPPVYYTLMTTVYRLLGEGVHYGSWALAMSFIMLAFEVGILILIRKIGAHLHGELTGLALAWVYALMVAPVVFINWTFESMVAFFLLLGLWYLLRKDDTRSALAAGFGALVKFTPALLLGAVFRFRPPRQFVSYAAITLGLFAGVYALLFAYNSANDSDPQMVSVSLTAQFSKASYQTVWAIIDDNYTTGIFGSAESHLDVETADDPTGNPAKIPSILRLALAGAVGLFVFLRTRRFDDRGLVAFVAITLIIFFLGAQGFSPQWLVQIIPLLLLCFPNRNGVLVSVLLSFLIFVEYPMLFNRTGDTGGVITGVLRTPFIAIILIRTGFLAGACVGMYGILRQESVVEE